MSINVDNDTRDTANSYTKTNRKYKTDRMVYINIKFLGERLEVSKRSESISDSNYEKKMM